ncbi:Iron-sulfur assembly protein 1 [Batrachochytrium dendrobatidis]|nr:Iron-sulfur assembly protein 1 [Batrachochytrium dendrobatidis]KAK5670813.1 Iron-sulfur assembly protein 1 [Batrachochytrium dendrobatidis]
MIGLDPTALNILLVIECCPTFDFLTSSEYKAHLGMNIQAHYALRRLSTLQLRPLLTTSKRCGLLASSTILLHVHSKPFSTQLRFFSNTHTCNELQVSASVRQASTRPTFARKAVLALTPAAVNRLRLLTLDLNGPKLLKVGTKKKGCSGQTYTLEYVTEKSKFDEVVVQDGVQVLIDSKALFSLIGSEMDYVEDKLSAQFVFNNPNVKEMCGCGQSFMT